MCRGLACAGNGSDTFCGLGATIVDSLDTLWLMNLRQEFARARSWVATELRFDRCAVAHPGVPALASTWECAPRCGTCHFGEDRSSASRAASWQRTTLAPARRSQRLVPRRARGAA